MNPLEHAFGDQELMSPCFQTYFVEVESRHAWPSLPQDSAADLLSLSGELSLHHGAIPYHREAKAIQIPTHEQWVWVGASALHRISFRRSKRVLSINGNPQDILPATQQATVFQIFDSR